MKNKERGNIANFFWLFRPNRTIMVAMIAGTASFSAGAGVGKSLLMFLGAWCLAVGGFSLDFYADRDLDAKGPRAKLRRNPLADGSLKPIVGLFFSGTFLIASFIVVLGVAPLALIMWGVILIVIIGLALHLFEAPLSRAATLGLLQALYILMGGMSGKMSLGLGILSCMFFFAMFGGRGMIDIRDFPQDEITRVQTLPIKYGIKNTAWLTAVFLIIAYALSLTAYFYGKFGIIYLYLDVAFIVIGLVCAFLFAVRPSPELARRLTPVFMMGEGTIICLAMILGTVYK
ncbi:MAG: UbiA prenyltransferase family protein [Spirochaetota bacterium]|nr:MAG: UbiA prenyltransferase family protein [Spirochaetota bacterium]